MKKIYMTPAVDVEFIAEEEIIALSVPYAGEGTGVEVDAPEQYDWSIETEVTE